MYQTKHHRFSGYAVHYLRVLFFTPPAPDCYCIKGDSEDKEKYKRSRRWRWQPWQQRGGEGAAVAAEEKEEAAVG